MSRSVVYIYSGHWWGFAPALTQLLEKVKKLAAEGSVRRLRVIAPDGDIAVDIPLTVGAIAGGAVVIAAPVLAVIGALAAFVTKVRIEIVREDDIE